MLPLRIGRRRGLFDRSVPPKEDVPSSPAKVEAGWTWIRAYDVDAPEPAPKTDSAAPPDTPQP